MENDLPLTVGPIANPNGLSPLENFSQYSLEA